MNVGASNNSVNPVSDIEFASAVQQSAGSPPSSAAAADTVQLGIPRKVVNGYLGITATTSASTGHAATEAKAKTIPTK